MRKFDTWNKHENPYPRGFWPNLVFMVKGACNLTFSTAAAPGKIPGDPDGLSLLLLLRHPLYPQNIEANVETCIHLNMVQRPRGCFIAAASARRRAPTHDICRVSARCPRVLTFFVRLVPSFFQTFTRLFHNVLGVPERKPLHCISVVQPFIAHMLV